MAGTLDYDKNEGYALRTALDNYLDVAYGTDEYPVVCAILDKLMGETPGTMLARDTNVREAELYYARMGDGNE